MNSELISLMSEFVAAQRGLCAALERDFQPDELLLTLPKRGALDQGGQRWEFQRHGTGVCFRSPSSGAEVDVTDHLKCAEAFDPWRFAAYCRSLGVDELSYREQSYPVSDRDISSLFSMLMTNGDLVRCVGAERLVTMSGAPPPTPDSPPSTPRG